MSEGNIDVVSADREKLIAEQQAMIEQKLVIRCECFKTNAERKAFCEGIECPWGIYLELKQKYRKPLSVFNRYNKDDKIDFLSSRGFDAYKCLYLPQPTVN